MALTPGKFVLAALTASAALLIFLTFQGSGQSAEQPKDDDVFQTAKYYGAGSCMRCHTLPTGNDTEDFVLLTEYSTWRTQDRHSLAYFSLVGPRGQRMGELLKTDVTKAEAGCLNCHSMYSIDDKRRDVDFNPRDGVSCDACHGPAEKWIGPHQFKDWRLKTAGDKEKLGLRDLRDPAKRADVCLSCHVGNVAEGKVVTHAMFAAGHPPLPAFETALFSRNLPQHWRNKHDIPYLKDPPADVKKKVDEIYHFGTADFQQTQLVQASSLVGLRSAMTFVAERSNLKGDDPTRRWPELALTGFDLPKEPAPRWPELALAQSACFACHHDLQRPSWRQVRGYVGAPGRPQVWPWPTMLVRQGIGLDITSATSEEEQNKTFTQLHDNLNNLKMACAAQPFGAPAKVQDAAEKLGLWAKGRLDQAKLQETRCSHLQLLRTLRPRELVDFESARQIVAAWLFIYNEWPAKPPKDADIQKMLAELTEEFNLQPRADRRARLLLFKKQFEKMSGEKLLVSPKALDTLERLASTGLKESFPVQDKDPANRKMGEEMRRFLETVRDRAGKELTETLLKDKEFLEALQKINDQDLEQNLKRVAAYDASAFRDKLKKLASLLPAESE